MINQGIRIRLSSAMEMLRFFLISSAVNSAKVNIEFFEMGAILDIVFSDNHSFVLEYREGEGFGVSEISEANEWVSGHETVFDDLSLAELHLLKLLQPVIQQSQQKAVPISLVVMSEGMIGRKIYPDQLKKDFYTSAAHAVKVRRKVPHVQIEASQSVTINSRFGAVLSGVVVGQTGYKARRVYRNSSASALIQLATIADANNRTVAVSEVFKVGLIGDIAQEESIVFLGQSTNESSANKRKRKARKGYLVSQVIVGDRVVAD